MKMNLHLYALLGASLLSTGISSAASSPETSRQFPTPQAAVNALAEAVTQTNRLALAELFGPAFEALVNPDPVQGLTEFLEFREAFNATNRLVPITADCMSLELGETSWPFPIPLVRSASGWQFDTRAGLDELLNRRIGRNELDVLRVLRGYVQAQRDYASRDRDEDGVLEYAVKIRSSPGKTDGLYWPFDLNGEVSPMGPFVAAARQEGYVPRSPENQKPQPFHGYYYKILHRQGKHAPGGKYDYIINGNMIGGFAIVAWPAAYGESGIMTFILNQQGVVYQRDLGPKTPRIAAGFKAYDPGPGWTLSSD